jgi:hypothetical protein
MGAAASAAWVGVACRGIGADCAVGQPKILDMIEPKMLIHNAPVGY